MDTVLVLLGLIAVAIPVAVIGLLIGHVRLRRRLAELERRVAQLAPGPVQQSVTQVAPSDESATETVPPEPEAVPVISLPEPTPAAAPSPWDRAAKSAGLSAEAPRPRWLAKWPRIRTVRWSCARIGFLR